MEREGAPALLCSLHFATLGGSKPGEVGLGGREEVEAQEQQKGFLSSECVLAVLEWG